jgi:hypothetical protein
MTVIYPPPPVYPKAIDSDRTLFLVYNTSEARLAADNNAWAEEVEIYPVAADQPEIWPENGFASISGELFYYDNVEKNSDGKVYKLKRCARNLGGKKTKFNHASPEPISGVSSDRGTWVRGFVVAEHHNQLVNAIIETEVFVTTLTDLVEQLESETTCADDVACPDVAFNTNVINVDSCSGTTIEYVANITGQYNTFVVDFGDGTNTSSQLSGIHVYAPNTTVGPVIKVSGNTCDVIQTPPNSTLPEIPTIPPTNPWVIPIPPPPDFPNIAIPDCMIIQPEIELPQIVLPCLEIPDIHIPAISIPSISVPSLIIVVDSIPSIISVIDSIPSTISILAPPLILSVLSVIGTDIPNIISIVGPPIPSIISLVGEHIPSIISIIGAEIPSIISLVGCTLPSSISITGPNQIIPTSIVITGPDKYIPSTISIEGPKPSIPHIISITPPVPSNITIDPPIPTDIHVTPPIPSLIHLTPGVPSFISVVDSVPSIISVADSIPSVISVIDSILSVISVIDSVPSVISVIDSIPSVISLVCCSNISLICCSDISLIDTLSNISLIETLSNISLIDTLSNISLIETLSNISLIDTLSNISLIGKVSNISLIDKLSNISLIDSIPSSISVIGGKTIPSSLSYMGPSSISIIDSIPSTISVIGHIPSTISLLGSIPSKISVDWGNVPSINVTVSVTCGNKSGGGESLRKRNKKSSIRQNLSAESKSEDTDDFADFIDNFNPNLEITSKSLGIPSEIRIIPPHLPDIKIVHDLDKAITLQLPDTPIQVQWAGRPLPDEIKIINESVPETISVLADIPRTIILDSSSLMGASVRIEVPEDFPRSIKLDASDVPSTIQVTGFPRSITVEMPSKIVASLEVPENLEIPLVYRGGPVPIQFESNLTGDGEHPCFTLVPCGSKK